MNFSFSRSPEYNVQCANQELLRRVSELPALPEGWRDYFRKRLWEPDG